VIGELIEDGFGDIVSFEGDCKKGELQVAQLKGFYAAAGSPAQFRAAYDTLIKSFDAAESAWNRHIPFSPVCGAIKAIGVQASKMQAQIATATGMVNTSTVEDPKGELDKVKDLVIAGAVIVGGVLLYNMVKK